MGIIKETAERCYIKEVANDTGNVKISVARASVEPGVTTAWHSSKGISERYIIISGIGSPWDSGRKPAGADPICDEPDYPARAKDSNRIKIRVVIIEMH